MVSRWRALEVVATATAALAMVVVSAVLAGHVNGGLTDVLLEIDTPTAGILFGYLWLLTLVAAADLEITRHEPADGSSRGPLRAVGWTAGTGAGIALVYLTVVFIVGFVAPGPGSIDPGSVAVGRVVGGGTAAGAGIGGVAGAILLGCDRAAAAVTTVESQRNE
ncbi:hypothetical protein CHINAEXTREME_13290 [Halobiforma lacisalsi AJ5]|uniref:DUF7965 domain-containing protein n=1 Tax=Natronobacterium lacisalsi AJ5 TaxID=358396 RepID=M0LKN7_NATLA|nr:hypothetical protein [Halobiforma lacisalsi]APW98694.1 hypothetical protein CHINAEXTREME_13290 [Halobiforma lacisalsi AJ5]EMA32565.1 hypothetical protein C445_10627 [Halobiforma lacisalsi AJ5]